MPKTHITHPFTTTPVASPIGLQRKADIAKLCNVSIRTIDQWIKERKIPSVKIGRTRRFQIGRVIAALERFEIKEVK